MGKASKDKGYRFENNLRKHLDGSLKEIFGKNSLVECRRVPLSGAMKGYKGDLILELPNMQQLVAECKSRQAGAGFKMLYAWLKEHDLLFMKADRKETLVTMTLPKFLDLLAMMCYNSDCK